MRALTFQEVCSAMGGRVLGGVSVPRVTGVSTDTRKLSEGSLFFAIPGPRFDGHSFVEEALARGAAAAVVSDPSSVPAAHREGGRLIMVSDVVDALGRLAGWYRRQFAAEVIAVAGSNGKTTTKDMIATVLGSKRRGRAAPASFNNAIGVPLTLLSVDPSDEFVVVEIGTNHPGEVTALGRMAQPDMAVITSIGEEHLEFFRDVGGVASEEFSLLGTMQQRAFVAIQDGAARLAPSGMTESCTTLAYGLSDRADLRAVDCTTDSDGHRFLVNGRFAYRLGMFGIHNVVNALAAIAVGMRMRLSHEEMAAALLRAEAPPMRLERSRLGGITLINDAYNANPESMGAAFDTLDSLPEAGRRVFILGDMRELGDAANRCHQAVGRAAGRSSAQVIIAVGSHARVVADGATGAAGVTKRIYSFPTVALLEEKIGDLVERGDVVLLKASRAVGLEQLVQPLREVGRAVTRARRPRDGVRSVR